MSVMDAKATGLCGTCRYWGGNHSFTDSSESIIQWEDSPGVCRNMQSACNNQQVNGMAGCSLWKPM